MAKYQFLLEINSKSPIPAKRLVIHIQDAVKQWGGELQPDDSLWPDNLKSVAVKRIIKEKKQPYF